MVLNVGDDILNAISSGGRCDIYELCGAIGCGKTSILEEVKDIASRVNSSVPIRFAFEDITSDDCLKAIDAFYAGGMSAVDLEITIIGSHVRNLCEAIKGAEPDTVIVTDRSLIEDHLFALDLLRKEQSKGESQSEALVKGLKFVINSIFMLDELIKSKHKVTRILIDIPLHESIKRIAKRGRDFEKGLTEADLAPLVLSSNLCDYVLGFDENLSPAAYAALIFTKIIEHVLSTPTLVSIYGIPGIGKTFTLNAMDDLVKKVGLFGIHRVECRGGGNTIYDESDSDSRKQMMAENYITGQTPPSKVQHLLDMDRLKPFVKNSHQVVFTDVGPATSDVFSKVNGISPAYIRNGLNGIQTYSESIHGIFPHRLDIVLSDAVENVRNRIAVRNRDGEDVGLDARYLEAVHDGLVKIAGATLLSYTDKMPIGKLLDVILKLVGKFLI